MIEERAREIAEEVVLKTRQTMQLDNPRKSDNDINKAIQQKTYEISSKMPSNLWDQFFVAKQIPYEEVEEIEPISININFVDTKEEE